MADKIQKLKEALRNNPLVEFAYLFGSRAKGAADEKSDWDMAIYFKNDPKKLPRWTIFYLEAELADKVKEEVQITCLNNLYSPVFLFQIINTGLILIENNPEKRILFETHVLKKYHDWRYFLERHMAACHREEF